jgi:folylpolyglutamate synthase/dihydropteroate synthase
VDNIEKKYQSNLDYLYSFVDYSLTRNLKYSPEKFNLDRMKTLVEWMGNPHLEYPIIHVAGTKGKGSTAAMIASILMAADYRTGFYVSPHLQDFAERIQVNNMPIPHGALNQLVENIKPVVEKIGKLTTFEITTALAFEAFRKQHVDVAVVEVGLGGRLDSTNIVNPVLSVITSLSMDHMNVLGDTLEKIAAEKAGIIKPGVPVVSAPQKPNALAVLETVAAEMHARLSLVGRDLEARLEKHSLDGQWFEVRIPPTPLQEGGQKKTMRDLQEEGHTGTVANLHEEVKKDTFVYHLEGEQTETSITLHEGGQKVTIGSHQEGGQIQKIVDVQEGGNTGIDANLQEGLQKEISVNHMEEGHKDSAGAGQLNERKDYSSEGYAEGMDYFIPLLGRHQVDNASTAISAVLQLRRKGFEISDKAIQEGLAKVFWPCRFEVLQRDPPMVIDSAHNRDSARKLHQAMEDYFPGKPVTLIFGASEDKDLSGMFAELLPSCSRLILTKSTHPRAASLDTLIKSASAYPCAMISAESIEVALDFCMDPGESDGVILAAGSLFVAAAVRAAWMKRKQAGNSKK